MYRLPTLNDYLDEALKENIRLHSPKGGEPQSNFIYSLINEHHQSDFFLEGLIAKKYYFNKADITDKKREVIARGGLRTESKILANTKKQHNFLYKLIKQKRSFLLSKPFTISTDSETELPEEYQKALDKLFNKPTREFVKSVVTDSILYGIGWIQKYYDENGDLKYKKIPALEVIPLWKDSEHKVLDAVIREYEIEMYDEKGNKEIIKKVEYYDEFGIWYYQEDKKEGKLVPDPDKYGQSAIAEARPNFYKETIKKDEFGQDILDENGNPVKTLEGQLFNDIPFIAIKYNADEISLLSLIKSLIDEYNEVGSQCGDQLKDILSNILKVKGYSGKNADEFIHNLNTLRVVFLQSDGDVDTVQNTIDIAAMDSYLDRTKEDIYDMAMSVNMQAENLKEASGVSLQLRFNDLILDCTDLGVEVESAIIKMIEDFNIDRLARGETVPEVEFEVVFNMDMPIDETAIINNVTKSIGTISKRTALENHPWVTDVEQELDDIAKDEEADLQKEVERMDALSFGDEQGVPNNE